VHARAPELARLRDKLCALSKHNWKLSSRWSPDRVIRLSHKNRPPHLRRALKDHTPPRPVYPVPPASPTVQSRPATALSVIAAARTVCVGGRTCITLYRVCLAPHVRPRCDSYRMSYDQKKMFAINILFSIRLYNNIIKKYVAYGRLKFWGGAITVNLPHHHRNGTAGFLRINVVMLILILGISIMVVL